MIEILTTLLVIVTGLYAYLTYRILHANRESVAAMKAQLEASTRPYVYFDLELQVSLVEAVVRNTGVTAAHNIRITITPQLRVTLASENRPCRLTEAPLAFLPPNQEMREYIGRREHVRSIADNLSFAGSLHYDDAAGHTYQEEFSLNLAGAFEMAQIARPTAGKELTKVVEVLNKIHQTIQEWKDQ